MWILGILRELTWQTGLELQRFWNPLMPMAHAPLACPGRKDLEGERLIAYLQDKEIDFAVFLNTAARHVEALQSIPFRGFHVIRDPRDIIVSAYFSHRNSHPTEGLPHLAEHRRRLQEVSKEEGLLLEMDFSAQELRDMGEWSYGHPDILEVKMEELTARPYEGFLQIFEFLGLLDEASSYPARRRVALFVREMLNRASFRYRRLSWLRRPMPVTGELLLGRVWDHRFEKKARRRRGEEDPRSHYRKGQPGDWRNHFTEEHVAAFKEKFGDLVVRLGYETDNSWTVSRETAASRSHV